MSNTLVIDTTLQAQQQSADFSVLGFRTVLDVSTITGEAEDPLFPFTNVIDFRDNTKYSPLATSGTVVITFVQIAPTDIDYFAFAIHNSQESGLTGQLEVDSGAGFEVVAEFSAVKTNRPFMKFFGTKNSIQQRLTLNFTSKLFIGAIYVGRSETFNRTPSLNFQPGRTAPLDTVEQFTTDGNLFITGRRETRGFHEKSTFRFIPFQDLDLFYEDFQNHVLDSKPVFMKWSNIKDQVMFAIQNDKTMTRPKYITSFHAEISFDLKGYA